jgi:organic radical activating enzyme
MTDPRNVRAKDGCYPVIEMFTSAQFEGRRAGILSQFLRLGGCNLNCPFCDTDMNRYDMVSIDYIVDELWTMERNMPTGRRLIITGGEPFVHDLLPLLKALAREPGEAGFFIAIESNGSLVKHLAETTPEIFRWIDWLTVSPKAPIPIPVLRTYASEVKYIIPDHEDLIDWDHKRVFVQPEFNNPKSVERCIELISKHPGARLSVQSHKYIGLR